MSESLHPYFSLSGEFDPDEVSGTLEIQPSAISRIGDPGPPDAIGPRLGAEWFWQPKDDDSDHVGDQLAFLVGALSLKRDKVAELSKKFRGTFHVYNQIDGVKRDWFLSAEVIRKMADLQINIECENISITHNEVVVNDAN